VIKNLLSFSVMLAAGLVVITFFTVSPHFNDPDVWFHLKLGQIVWNTHQVPTTDLFSHTAFGHAWIPHEWLAELSIFAAYRLAGETGLMVWLAFFSSLLFVLVYVLCYRASGNALAAFLGGGFAWFFGTVGLAIRPHLIGYIFLTVELLLLHSASRNRRWLWLLPPLFAVWVNCHGSNFFGMAILGAYWVSSFVNGKWGLITATPWEKGARRQLGLVLILCGLALLCNPVGYHLPLYPLNVAVHQSTGLSAVEEWQPPDPASLRGFSMIASVIGLLLVLLARRSELRLIELLLVAMSFGLALQHVRMLFVFGIVFSPVLCRILAPCFGNERKREQPLANAAMLAAFTVAIASAFPGSASLQRQVKKENPAGAVEFIRHANLSGPMLNEYVFGDYLIWAFPEEKVFIDGRGDIYDWTGVFAEYGKWATLSEDPNILLDKYKIRYCLLSKNAPMGRVLPYLKGWRKVYTDDVAAVFLRD
jgi:hypothetical protein